jgi:hypothetical protein
MADRSVFVEAGKRGARRRWGDTPRVVRLDDKALTPEMRHLLATLVQAAKAYPTRDDGGQEA